MNSNVKRESSFHQQSWIMFIIVHIACRVTYNVAIESMTHIWQRNIAPQRCDRTCKHRSTRSDSRHVTSRQIIITHHIVSYHITLSCNTCHQMTKLRWNCKSHETIAKQSYTHSLHSHHSSFIRKNQIFITAIPSSSSSATTNVTTSAQKKKTFKQASSTNSFHSDQGKSITKESNRLCNNTICIMQCDIWIWQRHRIDTTFISESEKENHNFENEQNKCLFSCRNCRQRHGKNRNSNFKTKWRENQQQYNKQSEQRLKKELHESTVMSSTMSNQSKSKYALSCISSNHVISSRLHDVIFQIMSCQKWNSRKYIKCGKTVEQTHVKTTKATLSPNIHNRICRHAVFIIKSWHRIVKASS